MASDLAVIFHSNFTALALDISVSFDYVIEILPHSKLSFIFDRFKLSQCQFLLTVCSHQTRRRDTIQYKVNVETRIGRNLSLEKKPPARFD